jgi:CBS domain-containing protein
MNTLRDLLDSKGREVWTIQPDETVLDAIQNMADHDIGSLVVTEDGEPVGIFTERHYAREVFLKGRHSPTTPIRDIMNTRVICASLEQTIEEGMAVMVDKRIRHLPVIDKGIVKSRIADQEVMIEQLTDYIHGPVRRSSE